MTKKFIITGSMRSGTTYTASFLNSQKNLVCLEDAPWRKIPTRFDNREDFLCFCHQMEATFLYLGLPQPFLLRNANNTKDLLNLYIEHLRNIFDCQNIGFKITMMNLNEMLNAVDDGYKIILISRSTEKVLNSWVNGINSDLKKAAFSLQKFNNDVEEALSIKNNKNFLRINFEDIKINKISTLKKISKFIDHDVQPVKKTYHSFNRGRKIFERNSSFRTTKGKLFESLPSKYSKQDIKRYADKVLSGSMKEPLIFKVVRYYNYLKKILLNFLSKI